MSIDIAIGVNGVSRVVDHIGVDRIGVIRRCGCQSYRCQLDSNDINIFKQYQW